MSQTKETKRVQETAPAGTSDCFTPDFTEEQLQYLKQILVPPCCHVSGLHDPMHFREDRYICEKQKAKGFDNAWQTLFGKKIEPQDIPPRKDCGWCNGKWGNEKHKRFSEAV